MSMINDKQAEGGRKSVRFYMFNDEKTGDRFVVSGRTNMDLAFDEVATKSGGTEKLEGELLEIRRIKDTPLPGKKTLGNYEIDVFETA